MVNSFFNGVGEREFFYLHLQMLIIAFMWFLQNKIICIMFRDIAAQNSYEWGIIKVKKKD